jgi:hypothetical protein
VIAAIVAKIPKGILPGRLAFARLRGAPDSHYTYYSMTGDIRRHLETVPFVPFSIRTADGREYPVPTIDHIYLPPTGGRVVISDHEGTVIVLPGLLISGLVHSSASQDKPGG